MADHGWGRADGTLGPMQSNLPALILKSRTSLQKRMVGMPLGDYLLRSTKVVQVLRYATPFRGLRTHIPTHFVDPQQTIFVFRKHFM